MSVLDSELINRIITELDGDDLVAIGLTGSYARGTANPYSDVDVYRFGQQPAYDRYSLRLIGEHLVSITKATLAAKREDFSEPDSAIWAIPGIRQMQILLDKNGDLAALKQEAENFRWEPLQAAADTYASAELMGNAEEAHKVMGGLAKDDESVMVYGVYGLTLALPRILLVQQGVMIDSENAFFRRAQEAAGLDSEWSKYLRAALGSDSLTGKPTRMRAVASLQLYTETAHRLRAIIKPEHIGVIETTIQRIQSIVTNR